MRELRTLGLLADEIDLVRIMRARADELNVSRRNLSLESGLTESHAEKLLCLPPIKYFGPKSFWNILESLGLAVMIVEDPQATQRFASRMEKRMEQKVQVKPLAIARIPWLITREKAREMGRKGGKARLTKLSASKRRKIARQAIAVRWDRVKAAVEQPRPIVADETNVATIVSRRR